MPTQQFSGKTVLAIGLLAMTGCANMDTEEQRMVSGGAAGAALGAVGTVMTGGCVACGAAIGGAVGVGAGYLINQMNSSICWFQIT